MLAFRTGLWVEGRSLEHPPAEGLTTKPAARPWPAKSGWTANSRLSRALGWDQIILDDTGGRLI